MATLWCKRTAEANYEVRQAGNSIRLYTDGVFHSQYNPDRAYSGGVWDLLLLPAFLYPKKNIRRVLVLGVGGGAVIRQLHSYFSPDKIVGIELNKIHIQVARKYFDVNSKIATLHHADAIEWVKNYKGEKFDLVIDDIFGEHKGEPVRAVKADSYWFGELNKLLKPKGMLVMNFIGAVEIRACAYLQDEKINGMFKIAHKFTLAAYANVIGAFLKEEAFKEAMYKNIALAPKFDSAIKNKKISFRMRRLVRF